jgi:hypothetical protein
MSDEQKDELKALTAEEWQELRVARVAHEERWMNQHSGAHRSRACGVDVLHHHHDDRCVQPLDATLRLAFRAIAELTPADRTAPPPDLGKVAEEPVSNPYKLPDLSRAIESAVLDLGDYIEDTSKPWDYVGIRAILSRHFGGGR